MQYECDGCRKIEALFRKRPKNSRHTVQTHNSFQQLEGCAKKGCIVCRVCRQALWLCQITGQEARGFQSASQHNGVWATLLPTLESGIPGQTILEIRFGNHSPSLKTTATVSCKKENDLGLVNLCVEPTDETVLKEVRRWLDDCHEKHSQCSSLGWSKQNPSYLVHIRKRSQQLELKLKDISQGELVRYAALSYSWGTEITDDEEERKKIEATKTTRENLSRRKRLFLASELPKTIQDVIQLAWSLGIFYIWVDSMCIPQGSDWNHEASKMHEVYGNACVTLCACSSEKSTDGLFRHREAWKYRSWPCQLDDGQFLANFDMALNEIRCNTPLFSRGWTLQEERLSPRILYL